MCSEWQCSEPRGVFPYSLVVAGVGPNCEHNFGYCLHCCMRGARVKLAPQREVVMVPRGFEAVATEPFGDKTDPLGGSVVRSVVLAFARGSWLQRRKSENNSMAGMDTW